MIAPDPISPPLSVSVIIPTYNRAEFVAEALDAVLSQLRDGDEVIVVNDGSKDNTLDVLSPYKDRIRLINQDNAGKSAALNHALPEVTCDLIWIVDDDDIVCPDARDQLVSALVDNPEAGFSYGRHDRFTDDAGGQGRTFMGTGYWFECPPESFLCATLEDFFAHQCGMMVRKEVYDQVGLFVDTFSQDYEMLIRIALHALPVEVPGILFHQRQHMGTRGSSISPVRIEERNTAWRDTSQAIVKKFLETMPLELFLPGRKIDTEVSLRRAHLQRAVIMARHALWQDSARAFTEAASASSDPLSATDIEVIRRISQSKYETDSVFSDQMAQQAFSELAAHSPIGKSIARQIGRSFVWRGRKALQDGNLRAAFQYLNLISRMWVLGR